MKFASDFFTSKTTLTGVAVIIATLFALVHHQIMPRDAAVAIFAALQSIWIRDSIVKLGEDK